MASTLAMTLAPVRDSARDWPSLHRVVPEEDVIAALLRMCLPAESEGEPIEDARREIVAALEGMCAGGVAYETTASGRRFDLCQIVNILVGSGVPGHPLFAKLVHNRRAQAEEFDRLRSEPPDAEGKHDARTMEVVLRRVFNIEGLTPGKLARFVLPLPEDDVAQRDVAVEPAVNDMAEVRQGRGALEARLRVPQGASRFALEARVRFTAYQRTHEVDPRRLEPHGLSPAEYERYTQPSEGLVQVTGYVRDLARRLASESRDDWEAFQRFWCFLHHELVLGNHYTHTFDPQDPLRSLVEGGTFNCHSGSSLLVALCRARGIPARVVCGYALYRFWVEVRMQPWGWVPADTISWTLSGGDPAQVGWRDSLLGHLPYQLVTNRLPGILELGARMPRATYVLQTQDGPGVSVTIHDVESGSLVVSDYVAVTRRP
jgi:hypothetical protein